MGLQEPMLKRSIEIALSGDTLKIFKGNRIFLLYTACFSLSFLFWMFNTFRILTYRPISLESMNAPATLSGGFEPACEHVS